jgi:PIN domain nuclease of toxin-antitoxin system
MIYLFDTNAWLWVTESPEKISPATARILGAHRGPVGLSSVSFWEVCLKVRKGKLPLSLPTLDDWLKITLRPGAIRLLPLDAAIARLSTELPGTFHDDPADRFIVATALHLNLTIVTSDEKILAYPHVKSLDTR